MQARDALDSLAHKCISVQARGALDSLAHKCIFVQARDALDSLAQKNADLNDQVCDSCPFIISVSASLRLNHRESLPRDLELQSEGLGLLSLLNNGKYNTERCEDAGSYYIETHCKGIRIIDSQQAARR